jgi:3-hydroxyisobutyrate dehydrogenase
MSHIAVLGLGAMGSRMAANLLAAGHQVTVWNRTPAAAEALVSQGAVQAFTPKQAAEGADFVIAMLRDDVASRQVWLDADTGAILSMRPGAIAIESSTLSPDWVKELGMRLEVKDISLLEAPVSGSRPQAEAGQLVYLVGGDEQVLERSRSLLETLGSAVHHVGGLGNGALVKLTTNALLGIQVAALAEIIGLLKHNDVDPAHALKAMSATSVWSPVATVMSNSMLSGNFAPMFPVELIEKDFGYALQAAGSLSSAPTTTAVRDVFRQAMAQGLGQENMTSIVKLFSQE